MLIPMACRAAVFFIALAISAKSNCSRVNDILDGSGGANPRGLEPEVACPQARRQDGEEVGLCVQSRFVRVTSASEMPVYA